MAHRRAMHASTIIGAAAQAAHTTALPGRLSDEAGVLRLVPISRRHLFNLRQCGMPHIKLGKRVLYDLDHVLAWLHRKERGAQ